MGSFDQRLFANEIYVSVLEPTRTNRTNNNVFILMNPIFTLKYLPIRVRLLLYNPFGFEFQVFVDDF